MKVKDLPLIWEKHNSGQLTEESYRIRLATEDAAKLKALAELYPRRAVTDLISDLLSASLNEIESSMPYVRGDTVIARDEEGDPLYEDVGPTPKFLSLTQKHLNDFIKSQKDTH